MGLNRARKSQEPTLDITMVLMTTWEHLKEHQIIGATLSPIYPVLNNLVFPPGEIENRFRPLREANIITANQYVKDNKCIRFSDMTQEEPFKKVIFYTEVPNVTLPWVLKGGEEIY